MIGCRPITNKLVNSKTFFILITLNLTEQKQI